MFNRSFSPVLSRSFFLFGPRAVGKSTLLRASLPESQALWIDLLDPDTEQTFARSPSRLTHLLQAELEKSKPRTWVVIDEIQKVPDLLAVVHQWLGKKKFHFALTGSSARKLRRGGADMLAGRASWFELFPLTHIELGATFDLTDVLNWGSLPERFELQGEDRARLLKAYASTYLKEEIIAEQLVRKVQPFRRFLELVALQNAQIVNYSKFAKDCGVDTVTIQTYFEILQDTLVGIEVPPFHESVRKRQRKNPKFYLFDTGVTRALAGQLDSPVTPSTFGYGKAFEQFIVLEVYRLLKTHEKECRLSYLTTQSGAEVDLIVERSPRDRIAIEIKSATRVDPLEAAALERLAGDIPHAELWYLSQDPTPQKIGNVRCLHWQAGLKTLLQTE